MPLKQVVQEFPHPRLGRCSEFRRFQSIRHDYARVPWLIQLEGVPPEGPKGVFAYLCLYECRLNDVCHGQNMRDVM